MQIILVGIVLLINLTNKGEIKIIGDMENNIILHDIHVFSHMTFGDHALPK
jgi:hypothetical protein